MKKIWSFNLAMFAASAIIMIVSGVLSIIVMFILYYLGFYKSAILKPFTLPLIVISVSLVISMALSCIVGRKVLKPINELIMAMQVIAKGDFSIRVEEPRQKTEINELMKNFNLMAEELGGIEIFRQDFINNFSHEFKTPIVSIKGFAKQLQKESLTEEQRKDFTNIIITESERLTNMASNILLLTKLENQQIILDKNEFYLDEQIRNCVLLLEKQWSSKNIDLILELKEILYKTNEEMLSHVWINLLSNAIKFSNINNKIYIRCYLDNEVAVVEIEDQGFGIEEETMKHIFDKFYQGDSSHKSAGNGLGLSLVKRIIELCDGVIQIKSEIGKGSIFIIQLPMNGNVL